MRSSRVVQLDAAIIGGGPAGAATALAVAQAGGKVVLLETRRTPLWKIGETLPPAAQSALKALGVWPQFLKEGHLESGGTCSIWGDAVLRPTDFIYGLHGSGWQLDRPRFEAGLLAAAQQAGAQVLAGQGVERITAGRSRWSVQTSRGDFACAWIVDASGRGGRVGRWLGTGRIQVDRLVSAFVLARPSALAAPDRRTWIEATPGGWWYSAPGGSATRVFAFQTDADLLRSGGGRSPGAFASRLRSAPSICSLLAMNALGSVGASRVVAAHSGRARHFGGAGWIAVGDAAMSFDPISGSGMLEALRSGGLAAGVVARPRAAGADDYITRQEAVWESYIALLQECYGREARWVEQPFWRRRVSYID